MSKLRVSLVQTKLFWEDRGANLQHLDQLLAGLTGQTDLIVLPEMFNSGFTMNAQTVAEDMHGPTMTWMQDLARRIGAAITGSIVIREADQFYNRLLWVQPDGTYQYYDKRHCFTLAGEDQYYTAGTQRLTVRWKDWTIMPLICYDLRFPGWSRNDLDYDLLIYVANFPAKRRYAWNQLLIARAIENQSYTIGVNRVGEDANQIAYTGDSCLIDYAGRVCYQLAGQEAVHTVVLERQQQEAFRAKYAFLADRDTFQLRL